jgi:hypothetical protein
MPPRSIDKTVCLDMSVLPQIAEDDVVLCTVHADAGETQDCSAAVQYASNGYSASFTCSGAIERVARADVCTHTCIGGRNDAKLQMRHEPSLRLF